MKQCSTLLRGASAAAALCLLAIVLCLLAGCAPKALTGGFTITDGSVDVSEKSLVVSLETDPATGYQWGEELQGDGVESDGVEQHSNAGNPEGDENTVGYEVFSFTGTGAGTQTITFTCAAADDPTDVSKTVTVQSETNDSGDFIAVSATGSDGSSGKVSNG